MGLSARLRRNGGPPGAAFRITFPETIAKDNSLTYLASLGLT